MAFGHAALGRLCVHRSDLLGALSRAEVERGARPAFERARVRRGRSSRLGQQSYGYANVYSYPASSLGASIVFARRRGRSHGRGGTKLRCHLRVASVTRATRAQFKAAGNKALQAKNFDEAIAQYTKARVARALSRASRRCDARAPRRRRSSSTAPTRPSSATARPRTSRRATARTR